MSRSRGRGCCGVGGVRGLLVARLPELEKDWKAHRESLRAAGETPDPPSHH